MDLENLIEVTQEDREAAAMLNAHTSRQNAVRVGNYDNSTAVQAFARHRLNSTAALQLRLEEARKQTEIALARLYTYDPLECARLCDEVLDRSGALLGRIRDRACEALQEQQTS